MHLLNRLLTGHKNPSSGASAEMAARALDTRAFYIVPRLNPDGAEWTLETPPRIIRSSTRAWPFDEEDPYGLERSDIDGDGRILNIRIKDPNGPWKVSEQEPRLLERRAPGETGGIYYRLMPEGLFHNFDSLTMRARQTKEGLDINRNFPSAWRIEQEQHGAGPFPTSEPEIRAAVAAVVERPNICGAVTFHTFSGVHLRPPSRHADDELPPEDLWAYQEIGKKGQEMTGYPAISNYHEFRYHPKEVITGVFDDWMYEHRGVFAWTTEIWSPQRQAGITDYKYIDWFRDHPFEDEIKLLKWNDEKLAGKGYVEWKAFKHPQLGDVELGGWDSLYAFRNPPPEFLEKEVAPLGEWCVWQALASPKLELRETRIEPAGVGLSRVRIAVQNTGWLPTNVTKHAGDKKLVRGVVGEIERVGEASDPKGSMAPEWLVGGSLRETTGQLRGWSEVPVSGFGWHWDATDDIAVFDWVLKKGKYRATIKHERAGTVVHDFEVG
jgi:murein tripeptide amidase MpaA